MRWVLLALLLAAVSAVRGVDAAGADPDRTVRIADFEDPADLDRLSAEGLTYVRVPALDASGGHYLRAVAEEEAEVAVLTFERVPADIRALEALTLRARGLLNPVETARVCLIDGAGRRLTLPCMVMDAEWSDQRVPLAGGRPERGFDPTTVERLCLEECLALEIDDLALVAGHGDWRMDGPALLAAFGERVTRVERVRTRHFDVYTDSIAARGTFLEKLEETYEFIRDALEVGTMDTHLPVTLFQSQGGFVDYLVRVRGWSRPAAQCIAGVADANGFATWYMAPQAPVVTHELTHSVFRRAVGAGGGSWFHEGSAVYVTSLHQGRSAARAFAHRLRHGRYVPLAEFMTLGSIARRTRHAGRTYSPRALYDQAGAFFEFLLRGPLFDDEEGGREPGLPPQIAALAGDICRPSLARIEKCLGHPIAEVEEAWRRWGARPPRR